MTLETPRVAVLQAPGVVGQVRDSIELAIARWCEETDMPSVSDRMARRALRESVAGTIDVPDTLSAAMGGPWSSIQQEGMVRDVPLWLITTTFARDDKGTYVMSAAAACRATSEHFKGRCYATYLAAIRSGIEPPRTPAPTP